MKYANLNPVSKFILSIISSIAFFGCAHVSKKDCLEKDWVKVGISDGAAGKSPANMEKISSSCSRYEMANPPQSQYQLGYDLGLKEYCTSDLGLGKGRDGLEIPGVCPTDRFSEMFASWQSGIKSFCNHENGRVNAEAGLAKNRFCRETESPKYFEGYTQGARTYCSVTRKAFELGKGGKQNLVDCPSELRSAFENSYEEGRAVKIEMDRLKARISDLNHRISTLQLEARQIEQEIYLAETRVRDADGRIYDIEREIRDLERKLPNEQNPSWTQMRIDRLRDERLQIEQRRTRLMHFELSDLYSRRVARTLANTLAINSVNQEKATLENELRALERR